MVIETNVASFDRETLNRLCAEIEIAWLDQHDETAVDRLAAQHPLYARSLYDFFALLVAVDLEEIPQPQASNVRSFMEYLTKRTNQKPTEIAKKMDVPYPFLLQVQRYPQKVPASAKYEIAERAAKALGVDREQAFQALDNPSQTAIAASRDSSYSEAPEFEQMIQRAKMKKKEQEYWASFNLIRENTKKISEKFREAFEEMKKLDD